MKRTLSIFVAVLIILGFGVVWKLEKPAPKVTNFAECAAVTGVVSESYPRQCRYNGQTFAEDIGNELEKTDLIRLNAPRPNQTISSPLKIEGEARGIWFFEASFPVFVVDWDGRIIGQGIAQAQGDWMTQDFVPFSAVVEFETPTYKNIGSLIFKKNNPSGLPENDDALEVPIVFSEIQ